MRQTTREAAADEYRAWVVEPDGQPRLRSVEWRHAVTPSMDAVVVDVLEGPLSGKTVQVPARHIVCDNSRLPPPEPAADGEGQFLLWA